MHSTRSTILGFALASTCLAQTSTVTLYIPGADTQPLEASIISADASATTYLLQCIPGTDSSDCGFDGPVTLTEGPTTAAYTFEPETQNGTLLYAGYMACSLDGTTSAVCVESNGGAEANDPGMSTETYTGTDMPYMPVIVTAHAAGTGGSVPASTTATSTSTIPASTSKTNGKSSVIPNTSGGSVGTTVASASAKSSSSSSSSSSAAAPAISGNAKWVAGGAAVAMALIA